MNRIQMISLRERMGVAEDSIETEERLKARWREQFGSRRRGQAGAEIAAEPLTTRPPRNSR